MAYFVELEEKSLLVMPTHRLIKDAHGLSEEEIVEKLSKYFIVEKLPAAKKLLTHLSELSSSHAFGMYLGSAGHYVLKLKDFNKVKTFMGEGSVDWKSLDVSILHLFVLKYVLGISDEDDNIEFVKDPVEGFKGVDENGFKIAFFLNPTKVTQIKKVAEHGEKMPRKATYFYPKPLSGLVIRKM
jgi:uncharacterized protein (DUF1015 family)